MTQTSSFKLEALGGRPGHLDILNSCDNVQVRLVIGWFDDH